MILLKEIICFILTEIFLDFVLQFPPKLMMTQFSVHWHKLLSPSLLDSICKYWLITSAVFKLLSLVKLTKIAALYIIGWFSEEYFSHRKVLLTSTVMCICVWFIYFKTVKLTAPRANSRFSLSQWETALLCNNISQWLGTSLESALAPINSLRSGDAYMRQKISHHWFR